MPLEAIRTFLSALPDECTREFEVRITSHFTRNDRPEDISALEQLIGEPDEELAYRAFYALTIIYRQKNDYYKLCGLFESNARFKRRPSYNHLHLLYLIESGSMFEYDEALYLAQNDADRFSDNAGYTHLFADVFATICEKSDDAWRGDIMKKWYDKAMRAVDLALEADSAYAKYYCTKARLLALTHRFSEALPLISYAISIEDSARADYALRLLGYRYHEVRILLQKQADDFMALLESSKSPAVPDTAMHPRAASPVPAAAKKGQLPRSAYRDNEPFVFISYAHADAGHVLPAMKAMSESGINLWYDAFIPKGENYNDTIAEKIENCGAVVFFVSVSAAESAYYIADEITRAKKFSKPIICAYLDNAALKKGMEMQLENLQKIFRFEYDGDDVFLQDLIYGVNELLTLNRPASGVEF